MTATIAVQDSSTLSTDKSSIRPFQRVNFPEAELELRRRVNSTRWAGAGNGHGCNPRRATRDDSSAGTLLGHRLRLAQMRGEPERIAAIHYRD
jgi:hypothetical protein